MEKFFKVISIGWKRENGCESEPFKSFIFISKYSINHNQSMKLYEKHVFCAKIDGTRRFFYCSLDGRSNLRKIKISCFRYFWNFREREGMKFLGFEPFRMTKLMTSFNKGDFFNFLVRGFLNTTIISLRHGRYTCRFFLKKKVILKTVGLHEFFLPVG